MSTHIRNSAYTTVRGLQLVQLFQEFNWFLFSYLDVVIYANPVHQSMCIETALDCFVIKRPLCIWVVASV